MLLHRNESASQNKLSFTGETTFLKKKLYAMTGENNCLYISV